jgi:effector-binding domain-containing protein
MDYEIEVEELEAQPTLCRHATTTQEAIGQVFDQHMPALWAEVQARGYQPAGAPYARYHKWDEDGVEVEIGIPLAAPVTNLVMEGSEPGELPGGRAGRLVHMGAYEGLMGAYQAFEGWLRESGEAAAGAPWEVYVTDPTSEPDSSKWRTEIYWPLR